MGISALSELILPLLYTQLQKLYLRANLFMDLFTLDLKPFKNLFYTALSINVFLTLATYIAGANVYALILQPEDSLQETRILLLLLVAAAIFQTNYQKKLLRRLDILDSFEAKATHYLKVYKLRLFWKCASCLLSCFLHILTGRNIFLYFAIFDVLTIWTYFPNKPLIRKELKSDEIVFLED